MDDDDDLNRRMAYQSKVFVITAIMLTTAVIVFIGLMQ